VYARLGRFCVQRRRAVLAGWVVLSILGIGVGSMVFGRLKGSTGRSTTESAQGSRILDQASTLGSTILVVVDGAPVESATTRAAVTRLTSDLRQVPDVVVAVDAYSSPDPGLRARDGKAGLIVLTARKTEDTKTRNTLVDRVRTAAHGRVPGAVVKVGGDLVFPATRRRRCSRTSTAAN
jgi:uncharacterized membrane protein YdfJ with MMPL/SSD domain